MNKKGLQTKTVRATTSKMTAMQLKHLIIKYHIMKRQIRNFDKKFVGYTPSLHHSQLQRKFGTSSLGNIKNALKMENMTNNIYSNSLSKHKENYNVNKRLSNRINHIQGNTIYHKDNHHFSMPHWKIRYLRIHNIKEQKLRQMKARIKILKAKFKPVQINTKTNKVINSHQNIKKLQGTLLSPQQYQNRSHTNIVTRHNLYSKPTVAVHPHTLQKGYRHPRHPERFQHRGFSI